jgi:hypothetical protein
VARPERYRYVGPAELAEQAFDTLGVAHPGDFTGKVVFRRCPACGERNIVRDDDFACALCDGALPADWNFASP